MKISKLVALALTAAFAAAVFGACKPGINVGGNTHKPDPSTIIEVNGSTEPATEAPTSVPTLAPSTATPVTEIPTVTEEPTAEPATEAPTDAPVTEAPTAAPTAAPTIPDDGRLRWAIDLDGDGMSEYFVFDINEYLVPAGNGYETRSTAPYIEKNGATLGSLGEISTAHVSLNTFALTNVNGRNYVLEYSPYSGSGIHAFNYTLWHVVGGELKQAEVRGAELFISPGRPAEYNDVDEVLAFYASAKTIWESARLIISSDWLNVLRNGLCYAADGKPVKEAAFNGTLFSTAEMITPVDTEKYRSAAVFYSEPLSYREEMYVLDSAFSGRDGYSKDMSLREKVEYSNFVIAEDRAAVIAAQELGIVGFEDFGYELIDKQRGEGFTLFVFKFPANLFPDAKDRFVRVENEVVTWKGDYAP